MKSSLEINLYLILKTLIVIFLLSVLHSVKSLSQSQKKWQWIEQVGSSSWDIASGLACDDKNNIYLAGSFSGTLFAGKVRIESFGKQDIFIAKYKDNGTLSDIYNIGGKETDFLNTICYSPGGSIIIGGTVTDTVSFGKNKNPGSGKRLFVSSLNYKGSFEWISTFCFNGEASLLFIDADVYGNIYAAGLFKGILNTENFRISSKGKNDIFLSRLSPEGVVEKLISFGSSGDDLPGCLTTDITGDLIFSCTSDKPEEIFGQDALSSKVSSKTSFFLVKINKNFEITWVNPVYSRDYLDIIAVKSDSKGNLYAAGTYSSVLFINDTTVVAKGYTDGFLIKYLSDGSFEWVRSAGTWYYDYFNHLNIDKNDGAIITGSIGDTLRIDTLLIEPGSAINSSVLLQFSSAGKAIWSDCISGEGRSFSSGALLDRTGNMYFTGSFRGNIVKEQKTLTSYGDQDIFIGKYFNCPDKKANVYGNLNFCYGSFTELSVRKSYNNVVWNDSITGKYSIVIDKPGFVKVRMTDNKGCVLFDSLEVKRNELPSFSLGRDTTVDRKDSLLLKAPQNFVSYTWQDLSSNRFYVAKAVDGKAGTYDFWLTVTDSLKCSYADSIKITFLENYNPTGIPPGKLVVYPNPASDILVWSLFTEKPLNLIAELTDDQGKKYYRQLIDRYFPGEEKEISIRNLKPGIYNLSVINKDYLSSYVLTRIVKK